MDALDDPIVLDVVLHEGGWFDRFLDERGPLLPDDELLLMHAWTLVDRTVYEIVATEPGAGAGRAGPAVGRPDRRAGTDVQPSGAARRRSCAAGPFPTETATNSSAGCSPSRRAPRRTCSRWSRSDDPISLLNYVHDGERPPELRNREGEALIDGRAVVRVTTSQPRDASLNGGYLNGWRPP